MHLYLVFAPMDSIAFAQAALQYPPKTENFKMVSLGIKPTLKKHSFIIDQKTPKSS